MFAWLWVCGLELRAIIKVVVYEGTLDWNLFAQQLFTLLQTLHRMAYVDDNLVVLGIIKATQATLPTELLVSLVLVRLVPIVAAKFFRFTSPGFATERRLVEVFSGL